MNSAISTLNLTTNCSFFVGFHSFVVCFVCHVYCVDDSYNQTRVHRQSIAIMSPKDFPTQKCHFCFNISIGMPWSDLCPEDVLPCRFTNFWMNKKFVIFDCYECHQVILFRNELWLQWNQVDNGPSFIFKISWTFIINIYFEWHSIEQYILLDSSLNMSRYDRKRPS